MKDTCSHLQNQHVQREIHAIDEIHKINTLEMQIEA